MCGIFCSIPCSGVIFGQCNSYIEKETHELLLQRGPNASTVRCIDNILFGGYVLWQQGSHLCPQPTEDGHIMLLFNGDIYNIPPCLSTGDSDTSLLTRTLSGLGTAEDICRAFREINGPYSFILYNKHTHEIMFGRDPMGRHSLLVEYYDSQLRILSTSHYSKTKHGKTLELHPFGIFSFSVYEPLKWTFYPWNTYYVYEWSEHIHALRDFLGEDLEIQPALNPVWSTLDREVRLTFDFYKLCDLHFVTTDYIMSELLFNSNVLAEMDTFLTLLELSVLERVQNTPPYCNNCIKYRIACCHPKIAVFFSGGIDCTMLSVLVDKYVDKEETIDLINVAFETDGPNGRHFNVPDRLTAIDAYWDLKRLCSNRKWNLVEVNVTREELAFELEDKIKYLIYPNQTVLDESIGCAYWFAARGRGTCNDLPYESPARVAIIGTGADELFGGYLRHRKVYNQCIGDINEKVKCVLREMERDWYRLPMRNLGRDDRVIGAWGKTVRAPFLEERIIKYVRSLGAEQRCCYLLEEGIGDKLFLRLMGIRMGLLTSPQLRKRAIQFGSRIANKKQNATEKSKKLIIINDD